MTSKPPDPHTFFLDESLDSEAVATALRQAGAHVVRASDRFPRGTEDEVWLTEAGKNAWIVLTRDKRIRYRQNERAALSSARVRSFVFTGGNVSIKDTSAILAAALSKLTRIAATDPGPFIYHIGRSGKPRRMD